MIRQEFVKQGSEEWVHGAKRAQPPVARILDGEHEARIIATRLGAPPNGYGDWMLRLLAHKVVESETVEAVSYETVRHMLTKPA